MLDISVWKFILPAIALFLLIFILLARGFGVIKLMYLNLKWLRELKVSKLSADDPAYKDSLVAIVSLCRALNSKWVLEEPDLNVLKNSYQLIKKIACSYHPNSKYPVEEARIRLAIKAFEKMKNHLQVLLTWKGVYAVTQFRIRHVVILSRAWDIKKSWGNSKALIFFKKYGLSLVFKWLFFIIRCVDLAFWITKMIVYAIQNIVIKVFLVRWYLIVGELAIEVYSDREKTPNIEPETILDDFNLMTEHKNLQKEKLPAKIKKISEFSRNEILYHTWSVEWTEVKGIYIDLIKDIAREYNPQVEQPIYEVKLFKLLTSGLHFFDQIAAIGTYPFLNKALDLRITHILVAKDTANFLMNSEVLAWVRKHKLIHIFRYSMLLFKVVEKKHPALLFKDFAFTLIGEGCKRWFYLYLLDGVTLETNILYRKP